jgi:anti-sigma factor RsiW
MNCNQARDRFLDMVGGETNPENLEISSHLASCGECAKLLQALQQTMSVMDEWKTPEISPYFDTRLQARLAEVKREEAMAPSGILGWLQKPVFGLPIWRPIAAGVLTFALAVAVGLQKRPSELNTNTSGSKVVGVSAAVNDLQKLEKNQDLYADFDLLDDLKTDNSGSGKGNNGSQAEL